MWLVRCVEGKLCACFPPTLATACSVVENVQNPVERKELILHWIDANWLRRCTLWLNVWEQIDIVVLSTLV